MSLQITLISGLPESGTHALVESLLQRSEGKASALQGIGLVSGIRHSHLENASIDQIVAFADDPNIEHLIIETLPWSEPLPLAHTLRAVCALGLGIEVSEAITVVCPARVLIDYLEEDTSESARERPRPEWLSRQIEFASIIAVSKTMAPPSGASPAEFAQYSAQRARVAAVMRDLNPSARVLFSEDAALDLELMNTGPSLKIRTVAQGARWVRELQGPKPPLGEVLKAHVYRANKPFHPERLANFFEIPPPGVWRARGFLWIATNMTRVAAWSQNGQHRRLQPAGRWWATRPLEEWPDDPELHARMKARWQEPYGDRRQEWVFIGDKLDVVTLNQALDHCLLTEEEMKMGPLAWRYFSDPLAGLRWRSPR